MKRVRCTGTPTILTGFFCYCCCSLIHFTETDSFLISQITQWFPLLFLYFKYKKIRCSSRVNQTTVIDRDEFYHTRPLFNYHDQISTIIMCCALCSAKTESSDLTGNRNAWVKISLKCLIDHC